MKKKIFHLSDHLPDYHPTWGGAEKVAYRHITALIGHQKDFEFYVGTTKPQKPVKEKFNFIRIWTIEDLFPEKLHLYITGIKNRFFSFDPISFLQLIYLLKKIKPDVFHLHQIQKISLSSIIAAWIVKVPTVLAIYNYWYFCPKGQLIDAESNLCYRFHGRWCADCSAIDEFGFSKKVIPLFRKKVFDFFLNKVTNFLVLSESNVKLLSDYGIAKDKIFVVRQVFYAKKTKSQPIEKNSVYLNAWMSPHKGAHVVVKAMAEVIRKIPQAKLYVDTKPSNKTYEDKVKKIIKDNNLEKAVKISIKPKHEIYLRNIKKANVVVVAEQWENMAPTTLSDAMSLGKPVVASRIGGIPEVVKDGENGLLANPNDSKNFARKIIELLKNPGQAAKMGKEAPKKVKQLGSEVNIRQQLLKLYSATFEQFL